MCSDQTVPHKRGSRNFCARLDIISNRRSTIGGSGVGNSSVCHDTGYECSVVVAAGVTCVVRKRCLSFKGPYVMGILAVSRCSLQASHVEVKEVYH